MTGRGPGCAASLVRRIEHQLDQRCRDVKPFWPRRSRSHDVYMNGAVTQWAHAASIAISEALVYTLLKRAGSWSEENLRSKQKPKQKKKKTEQKRNEQTTNGFKVRCSYASRSSALKKGTTCSDQCLY